MQANGIGEQELVKICISELCKKAGLAGCDNLPQRDLHFLCDYIESETGVVISLSTIKRLQNGQFSRIPQIATLDAIAKSAGYQNWQSFKSGKGNQTADAAAPKTPTPAKATPGKPTRASAGNRNSPHRKKILIPGSLVFGAALIVLALIKAEKPSLANTDKAQFSATKVTGNDLPNTVIFRYNIDSVTADSFFIQQSWDKNRRVRIEKNTYTLTDIYYEPGYHTAKLIANDKIIKKLYVSIPTDRWIFYAQESLGGKPEYIHSGTGIKDRSLQLTKNDVLNSKIDIQKEHDFVQVYFPSRIEDSSDNFVLKFRIKVNELKNERCPFFMSEVFCQNYFMYFRSTLKGCTSESVAQFGDTVLNGKTSDLSSLGSNVTAWQNVEFRVENKKVTISINDSKQFSAAFHHSCGLITGLGFISNGLCAVDSIDFQTIGGKTIYSPATPPGSPALP